MLLSGEVEATLGISGKIIRQIIASCSSVTTMQRQHMDVDVNYPVARAPTPKGVTWTQRRQPGLDISCNSLSMTRRAAIATMINDSRKLEHLHDLRVTRVTLSVLLRCLIYPYLGYGLHDVLALASTRKGFHIATAKLVFAQVVPPIPSEVIPKEGSENMQRDRYGTTLWSTYFHFYIRRERKRVRVKEHGGISGQVHLGKKDSTKAGPTGRRCTPTPHREKICWPRCSIWMTLLNCGGGISCFSG